MLFLIFCSLLKANSPRFPFVYPNQSKRIIHLPLFHNFSAILSSLRSFHFNYSHLTFPCISYFFPLHPHFPFQTWFERVISTCGHHSQKKHQKCQIKILSSKYRINQRSKPEIKSPATATRRYWLLVPASAVGVFTAAACLDGFDQDQKHSKEGDLVECQTLHNPYSGCITIQTTFRPRTFL